MKMAKPSARDIDAAGELMSLLDQVDRGDYPGDQDGAPDFFDPDSSKHLRAFYDAVMATMEKAPGYVCRVIGGMCYVIMYDNNEIIDQNSDVIDLHPKLVAAQLDAARLDHVYKLSCVYPFIAPIATKEAWLATVDKSMAERAAIQAQAGDEQPGEA